MADDRRRDRPDESVPAPDAPATAAEARSASSLAKLVDDLVAGAPPPPALSTEQRALLETATLVRASTGAAFPLAEDRCQAAVAAALGAYVPAPVPIPARPAAAPAPARRRARAAAWAVAGAAAAAALAVALHVAPTPFHRAAPPPGPAALSADRLAGPIARAAAGDASARLDALYADRSARFRAARLTRRQGR
jgi:hypothetical protein